MTPALSARNGVGRTFQHVQLLSDMSVIENVAFGGYLRGHSGAVPSMLRLDRAEEALLLAEAARQVARVGQLEPDVRDATSHRRLPGLLDRGRGGVDADNEAHVRRQEERGVAPRRPELQDAHGGPGTDQPEERLVPLAVLPGVA